ncbi:MAG: peptide chain release factor N(5)-glutamine methyltransferase [Gammaproteobacteria bacterium]|nr:peptide chain release factor N(5)-glutamine methyltransferase [Gammaproteobacteria bacterium]NNJ50966.1 peptide chain release factor N(5)-glutamine methyltransferase [Gammaproteobacteria bacterium]
MNIKQALQHASKQLADSSPSAMLDSQVLLTHVLQCNSAHLVAWPEKTLSETQLADYLELLERRQQGVPVAHLTGSREFWSLNFSVDNSTLIPRPETEILVEFILEKFDEVDRLKLLDMGTGTGAIAISIAKQRPDWEVIASDISEQALALATINSSDNQTANVSFVQSNWFEAIDHDDFNIIVSNPPYIAKDDPHLSQGDVRFEPQSALNSGETGMDDIEHICSQANNHLLKNGWLIIEHGYNQKQQVSECFTRNGFKKIIQRQDLSGHYRMTAGKKL